MRSTIVLVRDCTAQEVVPGLHGVLNKEMYGVHEESITSAWLIGANMRVVKFGSKN
jgi:hypothetical protein